MMLNKNILEGAETALIDAGAKAWMMREMHQAGTPEHETAHKTLEAVEESAKRLFPDTAETMRYRMIEKAAHLLVAELRPPEPTRKVVLIPASEIKMTKPPETRREVPCGEDASNAKLTDAAVIDCRNRVRNGEAHSLLAREYGVSRSAIRLAVQGATWAHLDAQCPPVRPEKSAPDETLFDAPPPAEPAPRPTVGWNATTRTKPAPLSTRPTGVWAERVEAGECKLWPDAVTSIRRYAEAGESTRELAEFYGVHELTVIQAATGVTWPWVETATVDAANLNTSDSYR